MPDEIQDTAVDTASSQPMPDPPAEVQVGTEPPTPVQGEVIRGNRVGMRVGAVLSANQTTVSLLGFGVYDGDHEPPFGYGGSPKEEFDKEVQELKDANQIPKDFVWTNPRITLDDGRIVWGMQCWWGAEESVKVSFRDREVVIVDLDGNPLTPPTTEDAPIVTEGSGPDDGQDSGSPGDPPPAAEEAAVPSPEPGEGQEPASEQAV